MQITVHSATARKAKRGGVQARFDKLRERIEREQKKNKKLAAELDELVRWLESRRSEMAQGVLDASVRLAGRLIEFFKRKSLSNWHREELVEWISEMGEQVSAIDPDAGAELHQHFVDALGVHFEMSRDEMDAQFRDYVEAEAGEFGVDDEFDDDDFDDDVQPDLFDEDPPWGPGSQWQRADAGAHEPGHHDAPSAGAGRLADAGWLRRLFRRAAQALHPDRETDPEQRELKHARMQDLLQARKEGDVLAMLEMYAEASGDQDLALAETEMKQACALMEQHLQRLKDERAEITGQSPLHAWAHDEFYRISRKKREQKIRRWERETKAEAREYARLAGELKNLNVLKTHLARRREQKYDQLGDLDAFFDSLFR